MTEERLVEIEEGLVLVNRESAVRLYVGEFQEIAEGLRRAWAEIEELKDRLERLSRYREALEGLPKGTTSA